MKYILVVLMALISFHSPAQDGPIICFHGPELGYDMNAYLARHLHYPRLALKNMVQGKVNVQFIVNEDGTISDCHIIKGIGSGCDEEAIRVVSHMPAWKKPDVVNGKKVKAPYTLPVYFKLTHDK